MTTQQTAAAYKQYLEILSPESLSDLCNYVTPEVHFADPFNDVHGITAMRRIFDVMFEAVSDIEFKVDRMAIDRDTALMAWAFTGELRGQPFKLEGMSRITFDASGRVAAHIDHWDSATQFYIRLPVIGWLLSIVRRRAAVR
jgi:steroid delta-isomerase|tara:strand:+ start:268 stop:693 length:426 start_codon:yes stop_codon:yes gene_type:complete